jgi:hypothetical protein
MHRKNICEMFCEMHRNQLMWRMHCCLLADIKPNFPDWSYADIISNFFKNYILEYFYLFCYYSWWGETESTWNCGHYWPIVPAPEDRWMWLWSNWWNEVLQGNPKYSEKTCPSTTLCTTNPTEPDLDSNPGRLGGKPATNGLSYGAA